MKLESVSIRGFRSVSSLHELRIGSPTLLTGHNDAGKSSILDAIRFLLEDYALSDRDATYATASSENSLEGELSPRVQTTLVEGKFTLSEDEKDELGFDSPLPLRRIARSGAAAVYEVCAPTPDDERLRELDAKSASELKTLVTELALSPTGTTKPFLLAALKEAAAESPQSLMWQQAPPALLKALPRVEKFNPRGTTDAEDAIKSALQTAYKSHIDADELKGGLRDLELAVQEKLIDDAGSLRDHIKERCADIGEVKILPTVSFSSGLKSTQISVTAKTGEDVHLGEAGAGRARRVALAVWEFNTGLLETAGDVVMLYDEPDTHLDYRHQRDFMDLVREQCSLSNVRMVIATHSMNLIDGIDISDVVHVKLQDHRTVVERLADESEVGAHLGAVAASLGLRNTVLLHERLFVGVEGESEVAAFPVLFRLVYGRQLESFGIALWSCDNNEGAVSFSSFLKAHDRSVLFLVDADSRTNAKHAFSDKRLRQRGLDPDTHAVYLGDPRELEDLFSDELWASAANSNWPRNDGAQWVAADIKAHRDKKFSSQLVEMLRTHSDYGPSGKPALMTLMALHIKDADQVPEQLKLAFETLIERAK